MRILLAALAGGVVMFVWSAVAHMGLGIGEAGIKQVPNEDAVVAALKANIVEPGIYFVPGMDMTRQPTDEEWAAWMTKYQTGPNALIVYTPAGETPMSPRQFGVEFASNVLAALVGAIMLAFAVPSFSKRVALATMIGLAAWLSINVSYWDWYHFPAVFVSSELLEQLVGWFLSGLAMAFILKTKTTESLT